MNYIEYLNSARKHQCTCEEISIILNEQYQEKNARDKTKQKQLVLNLYYLSGYIIECSVKYAIYHLISYDRKKDITKLDYEGITFNNSIKFHRYEKYVDILNKKCAGIKLIDDVSGIDKNVILIYRIWDAEIRYWYNNVDENIRDKINKKNIFEFFNLASQLLKYIEGI